MRPEPVVDNRAPENRPADNPPRARREQIRIRVEKFRQARKQTMFGFSEIIGLAVSGLLLLLVVFAYLFYLAPANTRLQQVQNDQLQMQRRLREMTETSGRIQDTQTTVTNIRSSIDEFQNQRLVTRDEGRIALYNEVNQLIHRNNLRNTSGPTYTTLEALGENQQNSSKSSDTRWQSIYPGIGVSVTVEGQYADLRRFVRDIESSSQFLVVNTVELESVRDSGGQDVAQGMPGTPNATTTPRGALVSLRVDMAAYFRRTASETTTVEPAQPTNQTR